jgi:hypothetical protein
LACALLTSAHMTIKLRPLLSSHVQVKPYKAYYV